MAGEEKVREVSASDILKEVPPLGGVGEELTPLQKVGYKLARYVFFYIIGATVLIFVVSFYFVPLPAFPVPPATAVDADHYKQLVDAYKASADVYQEMAKAQVERATHLFQLVVASTILPAFTAILGYIFGSKKSGE
jgi:uncharacterized membrane protein